MLHLLVPGAQDSALVRLDECCCALLGMEHRRVRRADIICMVFAAEQIGCHRRECICCMGQALCLHLAHRVFVVTRKSRMAQRSSEACVGGFWTTPPAGTFRCPFSAPDRKPPRAAAPLGLSLASFSIGRSQPPPMSRSGWRGG